MLRFSSHQRARFSHELLGTLAHEPVRAIHTRSAILTGSTSTLVDVDPTQVTVEARWTVAVEGVEAVLAPALVQTWRRVALVDLHFAVDAREAGHTLAPVRVDLQRQDSA